MNRDDGGKAGCQATRAGRQITEEEAALWHQLGRSIEKVKTKPRVTGHDNVASGPSPAPARPAQRPQERPQQAPRASRPPAAGAAPAAPQPSRPPALAELDRRTHRQVAAGKVAIDAVLDLHGLRQDTAHNRLRAFLMSSQAKGHRMVLVITGKGADLGRSEAWPDARSTGAAQRGVLRRSVPLWMDEPELRAIVLSYASAGVRHGGEGALYVRLRKARGA